MLFTAPPGHELSEGSPFDLEVIVPPGTRPRSGFHGTADGSTELPIAARLDLGADDDGKPGAALPAELVIEVRAVACDAIKHQHCTSLRNRFSLSLTPGPAGQVAKDSPQKARVGLQLEMPASR